VNCLRGAFENFLRFNKILGMNPKQEIKLAKNISN